MLLSSEEEVTKPKTTKKRKITGRMSDVKKKLLASTHEIGPDCKCVRLKCFQNIEKREQQYIIENFNKLTVNEQNSHLVGLVILNSVSQRRPRQREENAKLH